MAAGNEGAAPALVDPKVDAMISTLDDVLGALNPMDSALQLLGTLLSGVARTVAVVGQIKTLTQQAAIGLDGQLRLRDVISPALPDVALSLIEDFRPGGLMHSAFFKDFCDALEPEISDAFNPAAPQQNQAARVLRYAKAMVVPLIIASGRVSFADPDLDAKIGAPARVLGLHGPKLQAKYARQGALAFPDDEPLTARTYPEFVRAGLLEQLRQERQGINDVRDAAQQRLGQQFHELITDAITGQGGPLDRLFGRIKQAGRQALNDKASRLATSLAEQDERAKRATTRVTTLEDALDAANDARRALQLALDTADEADRDAAQENLLHKDHEIDLINTDLTQAKSELQSAQESKRDLTEQKRQADDAVTKIAGAG
jgi:hypothetical protein